MEWEPKLRTRYVGLLMNVLGYRFRDDIPTKLAAFERTVHNYENQSTKTIDDDVKTGVTMLGMEDMRVKEHLIRNSVRITKLEFRCERRFSRSREHNSTSTVNRCQCSSERIRRAKIRRAKARAKTAKAKAKARTSRAKTRPRMQKRIAQESKERRSEKVLLLPKDRPREGRVQKTTERPCRCRRETGGSVATSTRHSSGRAVAVLTPRRETHINVCHSHALCEQRNVLRVFQ